ncbi:putative ribonuclease H-like domain-containing protein [Tanacetum coccineum]
MVEFESGNFGVNTAGGTNSSSQVSSTPGADEVVAMLTVRVQRFIKKTGRNLDFKGKQPVTFDKSQVECYNCHKKGHFAKECKSGWNQGKRSYGDNGRRNATTNEPSSQALVAQDGLGGYDWSNNFDEPVNYALMAISSSSSLSSSDNEVQNYSKKCLESFKTLQKNYDSEKEKHSRARLEIQGYELALESLESRILGHEKNEMAWGEKYKFQNYELKCREIKINNLKMELEKVVKERDELKVKIEKWEESSKGLNKLLNSQMSAKNKNGLGYGTQLDEMSNKSETGSEISMSVFEVRSSDEEITPANYRFSKADRYHVVPPPITGNFLTPRADISFAGLDEYAIRKKIIESNTTELNTDTSKSKTSDTVDDEDDVSEKEGIGFKKIKACFVCKSTDHLIKDCDFYAKKSPEPKLKTVVNTDQRVVKPVWDNAKRVNHQKLPNRLKYPQAKRTFVPSGVLTRTGLVNPVRPNGKRAVHTVSTTRPIITARPVSTARSFALKIAQTGSAIRPIYPRMDNVRPTASYSPIKRSYYTKPAFRLKNLKQDVKTSRVKNMTTVGTRVVVNTGKAKMNNDLNKLRCVWRPKGNYMDHESKENQVNVDAGTQEHYVAGSSEKDKEPTKEYILLPLHPHRPRISVEDVVQVAQEKPSETSPKDTAVQDSKDVAEKEEQHMLTEADQALQDDIERMIAQEIAAKTMDDATRQAFKEKKKRAAQATSINKLNTGRPSVSTSNSPLVSTANTPYASAASTPTGVNTGGSLFVYLGGQIPIDASTLPNADLPIDPNMPDLEDDSNVFPNDGIFSGAYDDEDVGVVADLNNMDNTIDVSPIPRLGIHKDHPKEEPKTISQALEDESWVEAMQEELLQFKLQKVWILVDLPFGKKAIGTKWVFRNKRDERSIVVKNKARLVAQGFRQEEGIDYDEVFAPVARIEAIRLFLAFASFMGFPVYQMDVKSAFIYGTIEEDVYVHQPPGFVDPAHPNKVYKVIKALYGLHQAPRAWYETLSSFLLKNGFRRGTIDKTLFIKKNKSDIMLVQVKQQPDGIFISQDKYVADILKKFDFCSIKIATTPIVSNKPLVKDEDVLSGLVNAAQKHLTMEMMFGLGKKMLLGLVLEAINVSMANLEFVDQHNMVACLEKTEGNSDFHEIVDFFASSSIHHALTAIVVTEASIRSSLLFNDVDGTACLTNEAIFQNLALMGYEAQNLPAGISFP